MASEKSASAARKRKQAPGTSVLDKAPRKKPLTYTQAVGEIRDMFREQAALWNSQAHRLNQASRTSAPESLSLQVPWSSSMDDRGRPKFVFGENQAADKEAVKVQTIKKKLKETRQWEYKRPVAEEDEKEKADYASTEAKEDSESQEDSSDDE